MNDIYLQTVRSFYEMGGKQVHDPGKMVFILDHYAPASTIQQADNQKQMRDSAGSRGLTNFLTWTRGSAIRSMVDHGLVYPGMILVATDSHTTTHGAFGVFGTGVGRHGYGGHHDHGQALVPGPGDHPVPSNRDSAKGRLSPKTSILRIIGDLGADYGDLQRDRIHRAAV